MKKVMENELAAEVGETYRDATLACLGGLRTNRDDYDDDESGPGPEPEIGLEVGLLWRVVCEIEKCSV